MSCGSHFVESSGYVLYTQFCPLPLLLVPAPLDPVELPAAPEPLLEFEDALDPEPDPVPVLSVLFPHAPGTVIAAAMSDESKDR